MVARKRSAEVTLRTGFTTGTCAAAAVKGAAIALRCGEVPDRVSLILPMGKIIELDVCNGVTTGEHARCAVRKDAGDDPDVTDGCLVCAEVWYTDDGEVEIEGGRGVGRVTKPGLQVPPNDVAINPVPRRMIISAVKEVLGAGAGVKVVISIPTGEELAARTFNPTLGIEGGISILGTTGIVEPKSCDALKTSLLCALDIAKAQGHELVVLVPGNLGRRHTLDTFDLDGDQVVQMSNFVGFMLDEAVRREFREIVLCGHPGKLAKLLAGDFDTHSERSESALIVVTEVAQELRIELATDGENTETVTVEGLAASLDETARRKLFGEVAEQVAEAARQHIGGRASCGCVLFSMSGDILGGCSDAGKILRMSI